MKQKQTKNSCTSFELTKYSATLNEVYIYKKKKLKKTKYLDKIICTKAMHNRKEKLNCREKIVPQGAPSLEPCLLVHYFPSGFLFLPAKGQL